MHIFAHSNIRARYSEWWDWINCASIGSLWTFCSRSVILNRIALNVASPLRGITFDFHNLYDTSDNHSFICILSTMTFAWIAHLFLRRASIFRHFFPLISDNHISSIYIVHACISCKRIPCLFQVSQKMFHIVSLLKSHGQWTGYSVRDHIHKNSFLTMNGKKSLRHFLQFRISDWN